MRPYQERAVDAFFAGLDSRPSQLLVMATGLGKSVVMAEVCRRWVAERRSGRVLSVAHREELIDQNGEKVERAAGVRPDVEQASRRDTGRSPVLMASVQSVTQPARLDALDPYSFGLLLIDEAHHAVAATYRRLIARLQANPALRVLGVTATPRRADELALGQVFGAACFDYGIEPAIEDGWLVPVCQRVVRVHGLDFSRARETAGDLNEGDLERIVTDEEVLHRVVAPTVELSGERPTLVFAVTVKHARLLAGLLDRYRRGSAVALDGTTPPEARREQVARFREGQTQYLVNCGLFLEGFDAPATACVVMARPTKSLPLYLQVLGRGTRPLPGVVDEPALAHDAAGRRRAISGSGKPDMVVLDFVGNSGRHKIVTAQDALGGRYGEPARQYASRIAEQCADERPVADLLEQAADELALLAEIRELERRRAVRAAAVYEAPVVDPFSGRSPHRASPVPAADPAAGHRGEPATEKQVNYLVYRAGWARAAAQKLTKAQASGVIGKHRGEP